MTTRRQAIRAGLVGVAALGLSPSPAWVRARKSRKQDRKRGDDRCALPYKTELDFPLVTYPENTTTCADRGDVEYGSGVDEQGEFYAYIRFEACNGASATVNGTKLTSTRNGKVCVTR